MYNSFCVLTDYSKIFTKEKRPTNFKNLITRCGSVWGRFRAPPVAEEARKKEWRNKEYCETTVSKTTMLQQEERDLRDEDLFARKNVQLTLKIK